MVTYGLHANDDFLYVINRLRKLSSASALASRICPRLTSLRAVQEELAPPRMCKIWRISTSRS